MGPKQSSMKPFIKNPLLERHSKGEHIFNLHRVGGVPPFKPLCLEVGVDFNHGQLL